MLDNNMKDSQLKSEFKVSSGQPPHEEMHLDDERRVRGMSPSRMVLKRFMRNRLAIAGTVILILMFIFCFLGGIISPYGETEQFYKVDYATMDYASVSENTNYRYTLMENHEFGSIAQAAFVLATGGDSTMFESQGQSYYYDKIADSSYVIYSALQVASASMNTTLTGFDDFSVSAELQQAFDEAVKAGETMFTVDGKIYSYTYVRRLYTLNSYSPLAVASYWVYDMAAEEYEANYEFVYGAELAIENGDNSFTADGQKYQLEQKDKEMYSIWLDDELYANISRYIVQPVDTDVFLSIDYKTTVKQAVSEGNTSFSYTEASGDEAEYTIVRKNKQYTIKYESSTLLYDTYAYPSSEHWLGTDVNGMDVLTRLMYGGRVSMLIGIVTVVLMIVLGLLAGSLSGFFGKWIDMIIMRLVDVVDSIPLIPLVLILGMLMDAYQVDAKIRIILLILIMGLMYWTTPARIVRGQILTLREQEFMVATEATGLPVANRIFRHLLPNVMPQLIVEASIELGEVILMESTLSFLGLGVKFPFASWGNIANAVTNSYVMTHYLFLWVPAGICILLTVLGFNFVGDGLRDAFDPKSNK